MSAWQAAGAGSVQLPGLHFLSFSVSMSPLPLANTHSHKHRRARRPHPARTLLLIGARSAFSFYLLIFPPSQEVDFFWRREWRWTGRLTRGSGGSCVMASLPGRGWWYERSLFSFRSHRVWKSGNRVWVKVNFLQAAIKHQVFFLSGLLFWPSFCWCGMTSIASLLVFALGRSFHLIDRCSVICVWFVLNYYSWSTLIGRLQKWKTLINNLNYTLRVCSLGSEPLTFMLRT